MLILAALLVGCGNREKEKLSEELTPVIAQAMEDKVEVAKKNFETYERSYAGRAIDSLGFQLILEVHNLASEFYAFSDSLWSINRDTEVFPKEELIRKFNVIFDSIQTLVPDFDRLKIDYANSSHRDDITLTVVRMKYDIATLEVNVMEVISRNYGNTIFHDDFRVPELRDGN